MDTFLSQNHPEEETPQFYPCDDCIYDNPIMEDCLNCPFDEDEGADYEEDPEPDPFRNDGEADADVLKSAGFGTDEDYGDFGGNDE